MSAKAFDRVSFWRTRLPERRGERCRIRATGKKNSVLVEFERDGELVVTRRYAVRLAKAYFGEIPNP